MKPYVFFDLDGTLIDSEDGILNAVCYALRKAGQPVPERKELLFFIGPPLTRSFAKLCNLDEAESKKYVEYYREYYKVTGIFESHPYEGVEEMLKSLKEAGATLVLATCKPTVLARQVIDHFGLSKYFTFVSGPYLDGKRGEKDEVIEYAMQMLSIENPGQVVMIGDRKDDMQGAVKSGVDRYGVLWGFGSKEELQEAGAQELFASPQALCKALTESF